jgi:hypothetical protein
MWQAMIAALRQPGGMAFWRRWVLAATLGELVGFGLASGVGMALGGQIDQLQGGVALAAALGVIVLVAGVEGTAFGTAQWLVLRQVLPALSWHAWIAGTVAGGAAAWGIGMLAGTSIDPSGLTPALLIPTGIMFVLGLGALLGVGQWLVLRRHVPHAGWWIAANSAAWFGGLLVSFGSMALISDSTPIGLVLVIGAVTGLLMGAVTSALTGVILVWLLAQAAQPYAPRLRIRHSPLA